MTEKKKIYPNPKFETFEEEDKYWATHGPLEEGYDVKVQSERQKHSSFLSVRLTGEELTQLRDLAREKGLGPSTYIRTLVKDALMSRGRAVAATGVSAEGLSSIAGRFVYDKNVNGASTVKETAKGRYRAPSESLCISGRGKPLISEDRIRDIAAAVSVEILNQLTASARVKIIARNEAEFDKTKRMARKKTAKTR
jgi:hypothetical protein